MAEEVEEEEEAEEVEDKEEEEEEAKMIRNVLSRKQNLLSRKQMITVRRQRSRQKNLRQVMLPRKSRRMGFTLNPALLLRNQVSRNASKRKQMLRRLLRWRSMLIQSKVILFILH